MLSYMYTKRKKRSIVIKPTKQEQIDARELIAKIKETLDKGHGYIKVDYNKDDIMMSTTQSFPFNPHADKPEVMVHGAPSIRKTVYGYDKYPFFHMNFKESHYYAIPRKDIDEYERIVKELPKEKRNGVDTHILLTDSGFEFIGSVDVNKPFLLAEVYMFEVINNLDSLQFNVDRHLDMYLREEKHNPRYIETLHLSAMQLDKYSGDVNMVVNAIQEDIFDKDYVHDIVNMAYKGGKIANHIYKYILESKGGTFKLYKCLFTTGESYPNADVYVNVMVKDMIEHSDAIINSLTTVYNTLSNTRKNY